MPIDMAAAEHISLSTLSPTIFALADFLLKGYFQGKRAAEARLAQLFPTSGVALRPGFIHGTRNVAGIPVPLQAVGERLLLIEPACSPMQHLEICSRLTVVKSDFCKPAAGEAFERTADSEPQPQIGIQNRSP